MPAKSRRPARGATTPAPAADSGTPADVVLINYRRYAAFAARGLLEPLGPYLRRSALIDESERLAIPEAKFIGVRAKDYEECDLSDDVQIALNKNDTDRAEQIKAYPWFKDNKAWQKEINKMLSNGFKMEVESLITKDISYVTEEYVPERLKKKDWLD